jgi:hypothetical protein
VAIKPTSPFIRAGRKSMSMRWSTGIIRTLTVGCAVGLLFVAPPATRAQDASGETAVGFPDASSILNSGFDPGVVEESTVEDCKDGGGCITVKKAVHNTKPTIIAGFVEYNTGTCAQISSGEFFGIKPPSEGNYGNTTFSCTLSSGSCSGTTYTCGGLYYTANTVKEKVVKDSFSAYWKTKDYPKVCSTCKYKVTAHVKISD